MGNLHRVVGPESAARVSKEIAIEERRPLMVSGDDNLRTLELVDACYRSAELGQAVELR